MMIHDWLLAASFAAAGSSCGAHSRPIPTGHALVPRGCGCQRPVSLFPPSSITVCDSLEDQPPRKIRTRGRAPSPSASRPQCQALDGFGRLANVDLKAQI
ncbi:hypothetical protein BJ912DRAFT_101548 [Pholiota molesta]|nr:hypothetical protein BJ912DRAFT_101548 [Pholiota molesta]